MPLLVLACPRPVSAAPLAALLGATVTTGPSGVTRLRVGPDAVPRDVDDLVARLAPVVVQVVEDAAVCGMVLETGDVLDASLPVRVRLPAPWRTLTSLSHVRARSTLTIAAEHDGAPRTTPASALVTAIVGQTDWECQEDDTGLCLSIGAAACRGMPPIRLRVSMSEGDAAASNRFLDALRAEGWAISAGGRGARHGPGQLRMPEDVHPSVADTLRRTLFTHIGFTEPPEVVPHRMSHVDLRLPAAATGDAEGFLPGALRLRVRTDDPAAAEPLLAELRELGFSGIQVRRGLAFERGFAVHHHSSGNGSPVFEDLVGVLRRAIDACGATGVHTPNRYASAEGVPQVVDLDLPFDAARSGTLLGQMLRAADRYQLHVGGNRNPAPVTEAIQARFAEVGVRMPEAGSPPSRNQGSIVIGAAPIEVGQHIAEVVKTVTGVDLAIRRDFSPSDRDIYVVLPASATATVRRARLRPLPTPEQATHRPFLEVGPTAVWVGDTPLLRGAGHPLAPPLDLHAHTCHDTHTAALLAHLATSVRMREHVLLEGPTAAGKTSAIQYLAALLGQPVVRVNLGGQTDTGELIGRYAPTEGGWRWQEGLVPRAMREGWWLILDEINLAEPAVIERLNPVLERTPSLVLTEGDGTRFGPGGTPVAPGFLVFATMNPSDGAYGGRSSLSPALRDRFAAQRVCPAPAESDIRALLRRLVHGEQPAVVVRRTRWAAASAGPGPYAALAEVEGADDAIDRLARFHASVNAAAIHDDPTQRIGTGRREGFVVSRRTLLSVLDFLLLHAPAVGVRAALADAVDRYYLARASSEADTGALTALAVASGLLDAAEVAA